MGIEQQTHREAVGERFSMPAMIKARDLTFEAVRRITGAIHLGSPVTAFP